MKQLALVMAVIAVAAPAVGQDYSYGRIRHVEGGTTLQRASETGAEEAIRNLPLLPGDRVWTDESGRAEFQFGSGALVRLDSRSKLDYVAGEDERGRARVTLRLWSGSLFLHGRDGRNAPDFEIETPSGLVEARGEAVLRVDVAGGETLLAVHEGQAAFDDGRRRVPLAAGERLSARRGEDLEQPRRGVHAADEFARWDEDRERELDWRAAEDDERYLPEEVAPYAADLRSHGSWHFEVDLGHVWRPRVSAGWGPYLDGRWVWSAYGWTWVPNEVWGWAPFHYGRWGHSLALGWYWIPDRRWGPAWVSWSHGSDYIGWCPLGRGDRPVSRGGRASSWTYARRADLTARDLPRRRVDIPDREAQGIRVVERGHIDRGLRVVEGERTAPRNVQIRPTPGDTIPELRADPMTTIPCPVVRRRYASEDERREREGSDRARVRYEQSRPAEAQPSAGDNQVRRREPEGEARTPDRSRDAFSWIERRRATERPGDAVAAPETRRERATESERTQVRERDAAGQPDRDGLRRVFRPLSGASGRERGGGESSSRDSGSRDSGERARPHSRETPRDNPTPPRVERRESPPRGEGGGAAVRRKKDNER